MEIPSRISARVVFLVALVAFSSAVSKAQAPKRIAVIPFDDRTVQTTNMRIGQRVTDELISALAATNSFQIIDREYINKILSEQSQGYGDRFSAEGAAKLGKLANADLLIIGQIDSFSADVKVDSETSFLGTKAVQNGVVELRGTARIIRVETGTIILAPSVSSEQTAVLAQSNSSSGTLLHGFSLPASSRSQANQSTLPKLVDEAIHDVATQLSAKIAASAIAMRAPPALPKFVGIEDGMIVVNKGQIAGIKVGDKFDVVRPTDSGMKDPDTGLAIIRKKKQCVLTITVVEDAISSGRCDGAGVPQAGDDFTPTV